MPHRVVSFQWLGFVQKLRYVLNPLIKHPSRNILKVCPFQSFCKRKMERVVALLLKYLPTGLQHHDASIKFIRWKHVLGICRDGWSCDRLRTEIYKTNGACSATHSRWGELSQCFGARYIENLSIDMRSSSCIAIWNRQKVQNTFKNNIGKPPSNWCNIYS